MAEGRYLKGEVRTYVTLILMLDQRLRMSPLHIELHHDLLTDELSLSGNTWHRGMTFVFTPYCGDLSLVLTLRSWFFDAVLSD